MKLCLTIGIVIPIVSASWKPSVPSSSVRTWPVMNTTGTESIIASQIGVTRLVAPGPLVAERHADLAGRLRVALGRVAAARLVADEDVADAGVVERVVGGEVGAAGEAEYDVDTLGLQAFHQSVDCTHRVRLLSQSARRCGRLHGAAQSRGPGGPSLTAVFGRLRRVPTLRRRCGCEAASEAIATSGNSSSVPQRMQTASWSLTTRPQLGHCRRSSWLSQR